MGELRIGTFVMPAANLGPSNPLPALPSSDHTSALMNVHESVPPAAAQHLGYGCDTGCLPYSLQDGYDQHASRVLLLRRSWKTIFFATFLLELGGRLWSLWHKPTARELLFRNPVFNHVTSPFETRGSVAESNGMPAFKGHTPLSCSSVFAALSPPTTACRSFGCMSGSEFAAFHISWISGSPMGRPGFICGRASSIHTIERSQCIGGPTLPCRRHPMWHCARRQRLQLRLRGPDETRCHSQNRCGSGRYLPSKLSRLGRLFL